MNRRASGFTVLEVLIAGAILAVLATFVLDGMLKAITLTRSGFDRAQTAAWVQAELDFLRLQGYGLPAGTRTVPSGGYLTIGTLQEPPIPQGFDRAEIEVTDVGSPPAKRVVVRLFEAPTSQPYTILVTYVTSIRYQ